MSIIIFVIILSVLVFVHEFGHFITAKKSGIRVDEFAIGFPPKIFSFKKGETVYALNLIPFGGYVKIFGENPDEDSLDPNAKDSFVNKSKWTQSMILIAGILFNILFAWILFSITFMTGFPSIVTENTKDKIADSNVVITKVLEESPAQASGLQVGDEIISLVSGNDAIGGDNVEILEVQKFIAEHEGEIAITFERGNETITNTVVTSSEILDNRAAIGISMDLIGNLQLPIHLAIIEGFMMTGQMLRDITIGLGTFLWQTVTGKASLDNIAGPVGIVSLVGDASQFGFIYLLGFTAFISLNLAVLNLVPFPALDGGRLLFILIEGISGRQIKPVVANMTNFIGFAILILLMLVVTVSDVLKLF